MKVIIVGAGYAGLACGAILAKSGHQVHLYEAHTYVGGCASFFKRKDFKFDAGATTLSGLGENRPLKTLTDLLEIDLVDLNVKKLSSPMAIHLDDGTRFLRHSDLKKHIEIMTKVFPGHDHEKFWTQLKEREDALWSILSKGQYFPPKSFKDLFNLVDFDLVKKSSLGLWAFTPFEKTLPKTIQKDRRFMAFLNEQLLISTQGHADTVPALLAAMGLIYPDDMYYTQGGMVSLADKLVEKIKENGGEVFLRRPVTEISTEKLPGKFLDKKFSITARGPGGKEIFDSADVVISNLTIWDTPKILSPSLKKYFPLPKTRGAWGALTAYFAVKPKNAIEPLYHQVHTKEGSLFFSFSDLMDSTRAPVGWQTVTVSTHTKGELWQEHPSYNQGKEDFKNLVLTAFKKVIATEEIEEMTQLEVGTPLTFERFTKRHHGLVGGLPHNLKNNILTFPAQETAVPGLYQIGDTTFPGQGVVGVVTGALMLAGKLNNTNYLV